MGSWVDQLVKEYSDTKRQLEKYRDTLDREDLQQQNQLKTINGMVSDMQYAIDWMRIGRRPDSYRGVDITDAYSRSILMDMDLLPTRYDEPEQEREITQEQKKRLVNILLQMSTRERQCYLLHMAQGMSLAEIAEELKMAKGAVQMYVRRAKSKVGQAV